MSGTWAWLVWRQTQYLAKPDLPNRSRNEVCAPHNFVYALLGIIENRCQVVGRHTIVSLHHEVVDDAGHLPVDPIGVRELDRLGSYTKSRGPFVAFLPAFRFAQVPARTRIRTLGKVQVWGGGRFPDFTARAEA